jgi:hypothetical protein
MINLVHNINVISLINASWFKIQTPPVLHDRYHAMLLQYVHDKSDVPVLYLKTIICNLASHASPNSNMAVVSTFFKYWGTLTLPLSEESIIADNTLFQRINKTVIFHTPYDHILLFSTSAESALCTSHAPRLFHWLAYNTYPAKKSEYHLRFFDKRRQLKLSSGTRRSKRSCTVHCDNQYV